MAKKKTPEPPENDFAAEELLDICGFTSEPIISGECIASFSFGDDSTDESNEPDSDLSNNNIDTSKSTTPNKTIDLNNSTNNNTDTIITNHDDNYNTSSTSTSQIKKLSNNDNILIDNRKTPIVNGCAPPIGGEYLNVKRTYMLRSSTVRKLNELKSIHPDLNTYVSTLVDLAIAHYYEHIVNEGGTQ